MKKNNICLSLAFTLCLSCSLYSQNFWSKIESPTKNDLNTLFFIDSLRGWVAGDSGLILYTSDGGKGWVQQQSNTDRNIIDMFFLSENLGWAVAWTEGLPPFATFILKTTDGGINWAVEQFRQDYILMFAIYFLDSLTGFIGGNPGGIFKTTDGGINWDSTSIEPSQFAYFPVLNFNFYNEQYGFACGGAHDIAGVTWKTTDGGNYWVPIDPLYAPFDEVWDLHYFDSSHVLGVSGDPDFYGVGILRTIDAGLTWTYNEIGLIGKARAISFRTGNEGWAPVPGPEALIQTQDYGYTWIIYITPDTTSIYDLMFTDSLTGYAAGDEGAILKYKYPIVNTFDDNIPEPVGNFILYQNYPNPFNPSTEIKYFLASDSYVSLIVYDVLGNEIEKLIESYQPAGHYSEKWNAENLPSGIYYYRLQAGDFSEARKMILLR